MSGVLKEDGLQGVSTATKHAPGSAMTAVHDGSMSAADEKALVESLVKPREKRNELHPVVQTLTSADVERCTELEAAAFPPHERATKEKFEYRLRHCSDLALGIFITSPSDTSSNSSPALILAGHIISTLSTHTVVTDADMILPTPDASSKVGHNPAGTTLCLHSLAVDPAYHHRGLGTTLLKSYLQRMQERGGVERVALIAHGALVPFYESFGFEDRGESPATFGGGGWRDMVLGFDVAG